MIKINLIIIDKKGKDSLYAPLIEHYKKISKPFAKIEVIEIFNRDIAKSQDISPAVAKSSYTKAFNKYLKSGYNIALNPSSKEVDSFEFAKLLLSELHVATTPGVDFGQNGTKKYLRFAYTREIAHMKEGISRIKEYLIKKN